MRKYILLLFLMSGLIWSCSDSELVTPGDEFQIPLAPGTFSVEIDSELTDFSETTSVMSNDVSTQISGANENGQSINFSIASPLAEGNYNQGAGVIVSLNLGGEDGPYLNIDDQGQFLPFKITITDLDMVDMVVSGTFSGTVYNMNAEETLELTNGQFVELPFTMEAGGDGILRANFSNGTDTVLLDFSSNAQATGMMTSAVISGENVDQVQTLSISVPDGIEVGTYTETDEVVIQVNLGTSDNPSDVYTNYDAANDVYLPFNLVITEITSDVDGHVIGTFSGTIQKFGSGNDEQIEITDGEINVPIVVP